MDEKDTASEPASRGAATLLAVLKELGWDPRLDEDAAGLVVDFGPPYLPVAYAYAAISAESELFVFYLNFGVAAAEDRRDEGVKFLNLANWGLMSGSFEMDYEDGQIRFRSSVCFRGTELSETLIRNAILFAMDAVERYAESLIDVIARGKSAESAFLQCEGQDNSNRG